MFGWGSATRIYLAAGVTDMRKGFEGLYGLVRDQLQLEPLSGHIFIFSNAQRNRLKLLFWDGSGLWVCAKRLERGRFGWPPAEAGARKVVLSQEELALLLGGIDLADSKRRAWFRKGVGESQGELAVKPPRTTLLLPAEGIA
jgi:transposase